MNHLRYIYRYLINSILRLFANICGRPLNIFDNVIIIAPHPDDEILGCGGLITYLNQKNKLVSIIFLTKGENCNPKIDPEVLKNERRNLTDKALDTVCQSKNRVYFLDFVDGNINMGDPEVEKLRSLVHQINPQAIFVTLQLEGWNDHIQSNLIIKDLIKNRSVKLYEYCVWFWFNIPYSKFHDIKWKNARIFRMKKEANQTKKKAINDYMIGKNPEGLPYSGDLPPILLKCCSWREEVYFENYGI